MHRNHNYVNSNPDNTIKIIKYLLLIKLNILISRKRKTNKNYIVL